jgi:ABC-2 type transport system permease protein
VIRPTHGRSPGRVDRPWSWIEQLIDVTKLRTGAGYFNAEVFTGLVPILFVIYGIARGARLVAGDEQAGTLEAVLVTPLCPTRLLLQSAAALGTALFALGSVPYGSTLVLSAIFGLGIGAGQLAAACLTTVQLGVEHGTSPWRSGPPPDAAPSPSRSPS